MISALGILTTMARYGQPNLTLIVLDNASYSTFGAGMISATAAGVDLAAVSRGCGLDRTMSVDDARSRPRRRCHVSCAKTALGC